MNIVLWIVSGGIAGWVASLIVGSDMSMGLLGNVIVGVAGAFIGGKIASIGNEGERGVVQRPTSIVSFLWAVAGACALLLVVNLIW